jgi:hypothetical protein
LDLPIIPEKVQAARGLMVSAASALSSATESFFVI